MGRYRLAKRAGAARGAYMADMEMYNRGRQAALDQIARDNAAQLAEMRRQQMGFAANAEQRAAAEEQRAADQFARNQKWNTQKQAWAEEDRKRNLAQEAEDRKMKERLNNAQLDQIQARTDYIDSQTDQNDVKTDILNTAGTQPGYLPRMTGRPAAGMPRAAENGNNPAAQPPTGNPFANNPTPQGKVSDSQRNKTADHVNPRLIDNALSDEFSDADAHIEKLTGKSPEDWKSNIAAGYQFYVSQGGTLDPIDYARMRAKEIGLPSKYDLRPLHNAMNDKKKYGFGAYGMKKWTMESKYARQNPKIYEKQKQLIDNINTGSADLFGNGKYAVTFSHDIQKNPDLVRSFAKYIKAGKSNEDAIIYSQMEKYAKENNLNLNAMIGYVTKTPSRKSNFVNAIKKHGLDAVLRMFSQRR